MRHACRGILLIGLMVASGVTTTLDGQGTSPATDLRPLFTDAVSARPLAQDLAVVRQRAVRIDLPAIGGVWGALPASRQIQLNLFPDAAYVATMQRIETSPRGVVWLGTIDGEPLSQVVLATVDGAVSGSISMPHRFFDIQPAAAGLHVISEVDDRLRPADGEILADTGPRVQGSAAPVPQAAANDDPSSIDVLVVYTTEVKNKRGSESSTLSMIDAAVAEANQSYQNSGIQQRLRLVGTAEVDYTEAGDLGVDLPRLRDTKDGFLDEVHALRDQKGADLVALVVETDPKYCGMAYVITNPASASANQSGFAVVKRTCMTGYSFAHELGHNMGAQHDWYVNANNGVGRYSHGYVDLDGGFRTVMAYSDLCTDSSRSCTRVAYWSNPDLTYKGRPLGVPDGTSTGCTVGNKNNPACDADNRRTLNATAQGVANFRFSRFTGTTIAFPPRNETYDFRAQLEAKYRDGLGRRAQASYSDVEGSVVWVSEYLMYRIHACDHQRALDKVRLQIQGGGLPSVCGLPPTGAIAFPPRNETYAMRLELETIYRDELKRQAVQTTVDPEGDVVWIQEYLRYRVNGCDHIQAVTRTMRQIDGFGVDPVCR